MPFTQKSDNTRVNRPQLQYTVERKLQPGQIKLPNGQIINTKQELVSQGSKEATPIKQERKQKLTRIHEKQKEKERQNFTIHGLMAPLQLISPSHIIGSVNSDKPFMEAYLGEAQSATGNTATDIALDLVVDVLTGKALLKGARAMGDLSKTVNSGVPRKIYTQQVKKFKDNYGKEIIPTPYPGTDPEMINVVNNTHLSVLRDYFSTEKVNQIKKTMNWGDQEISELQDEILRTIGTGSNVQIKGPEDGFVDIARHHGKILGSGNSATGKHVITLNRERIPDNQTIQEGAIHEIGLHGKTASLQPEDFNTQGSYSNVVKDWFPRLAQITQKNKELSDNILQLNRRGQFLNQFSNSADVERYISDKKIPWDRYNKINDAAKYFRYVKQADETAARGYTGQLFEKLNGPDAKTINIQQLEQFYTPESVEKFKKAVLGITPTVIGIQTQED